ncbi:unnamed protein product [Lepeophtheirus salmonis]|uniref:(salmon louse) hypothetical protein n=1 Tax=Lepeophtheirus salmonis TaxID=72036 RepID=A0A7R8H7F0_LEPSM|nr:unnamed protein product [Lepeophtheirus salmonis]CAF2919504.1 unnamed protein product [Lepeophtheirus salmonis]
MTSNGQFIPIDNVNISGNHHTPEYLLELAQSSIKKCGDNFGCSTGGIVTDIAANVNKMRKLLEESTQHNIISYGCAADLLNLLAHDLEIDNLIDPAVRSKVSNIELKHSAVELLSRLQSIAMALDQGKELNEEEMNMEMEYTNKKYPALVPIIMKLKAR